MTYDREMRVRVKLGDWCEFGGGGGWTTVGEPLSTLAARALNLGFFGLFDLLAPWVLPGVVASSIVAGVFARGDYDDAHAVAHVRQSFRDILIQAGKVFAFIAGLVMIS